MASGGKARFKWPVNMHDVEINTADDATRVDGGCIYNEVKGTETELRGVHVQPELY